LHRPDRDREALPRAAAGRADTGDDERGDGGLPARSRGGRRDGPAPARRVERGRRSEVRAGRGPRGRGGATPGRGHGPRAVRGSTDEGGGAGAGPGRVMDLAGFRFQDPLWLWLALLGPLAVVLALVRERSGRALAFPGLGRL